VSGRSIVIHGHFYQPPREDPWLDEVEREESAAPFHDWNERIEQECYRAVAAARLPGAGGRIAAIANLYEGISFNFGPTLLEWMERQAPGTYEAVLSADGASRRRLGHGNALAMPYHHAILPLSTRREKTIEVRWGIADFRRRFGRDPAGMWLPETAVDDETLDVLAQEGIAFTVLAPHQVAPLPPRGLPARVRTTGGRSIAAFVYDGSLSHDVAFGPLIRSAERWVERLLRTPEAEPPPALVAMATDGETYGHHHQYGEMALARTLETLQATPGVTLENFASFLARHPPAHDVTLMAPSAWSCAHGVERWRSDCGCRMAPGGGTQQRWRGPLREAMSWLTAECESIYQREAGAYFENPADALDRWGAVIGQDAATAHQLGLALARPRLPPEARVRAIELLEMQRGALRSLTSCAWFFDDIGGIESLQVLRYAAWALALTGSERTRIEDGFTARLALAESNVRTLGTGREIYLQRVRPHLPPPVRIAAGLAAARRIAPGAAGSRAWEITGPDEALVLANRRTGRRYTMIVALRERGLDLETTIESPGWYGPVTLAASDLPERQAAAIRAELRLRTLRRLLEPVEVAELERGTGLRAVVRGALLRHIRRLASDRGDQARQAVVDLLTILEELGQAAPFEAQTLYYQVWKAVAPADPEMVQLARRLGFATDPPH